MPGARVKLAVNKRSGALGKYLKELAADDSPDRAAERWFYSTWLSKIDPETRYLLRDEDLDGMPLDGAAEARTTLGESGGVSGAREGETLQDVINAAKRTPDFWSLDNPVLTGTAVTIGAGALLGLLSGGGR